MTELLPVQPHELHAWWPRVRPGVERVLEKTGERFWIPEDVYASLQAGASGLLVGTVEGEMRGFVVLTPVKEYAGLRTHVWVMRHEGEGDFIAVFGEKFETICRQHGSRWITFDSPRKGWERRLAPAGYVAEATRYRKEIA